MSKVKAKGVKPVAERVRVISGIKVRGGEFEAIVMSDGSKLDGVFGVQLLEPKADDGVPSNVSILLLRVRVVDFKVDNLAPAEPLPRTEVAPPPEPRITAVERSFTILDRNGRPLVQG